jgi:IclR family transcriptional regulator, pca regulon regulatory protein
MHNLVTHSTTSRYFVQSLANGLKVLECFGKERDALTLMEVARSLEWTKASAYRYLATLTALGYLQMEEPSRRYRPTVRVLNLGHATLNALTFPELALPFLERISRRFNESASMAVLDGTEVVYVARAASTRRLATHIHVGSRLPAFCTSLGKVLLAFLPDAERESLLKRIAYKRFTPNTITDQRKLRRLLIQVRRQGYALNDQELDLGLRSCSVPVFGKQGEPLGAINVSASSARLSLEEAAEKVVPELKIASREITEVLKSQD